MMKSQRGFPLRGPNTGSTGAAVKPGLSPAQASWPGRPLPCAVAPLSLWCGAWVASFLQQLPKGMPQSQPGPPAPAAAPERGGEGCRVRAAGQEMGSGSPALLAATLLQLSWGRGTLCALCLRFRRDEDAQGARLLWLWARQLFLTGLGPGAWAGMVSLCSTLGPFWAPSTAMSQGLLPSPASLSRLRWQPLPLGEALATGWPLSAPAPTGTWHGDGRKWGGGYCYSQSAVSVSIPWFY